MISDYFDELNEAIKSGDQKEIDRIKRKILLNTRDESIDRNFIEEIKGYDKACFDDFYIE